MRQAAWAGLVGLALGVGSSPAEEKPSGEPAKPAAEAPWWTTVPPGEVVAPPGPQAPLGAPPATPSGPPKHAHHRWYQPRHQPRPPVPGVACYAKLSDTPAYIGYYVGGGCGKCKGGPRLPWEGTWGWDYSGHCFHRRVVLWWCHCSRYQGGKGAYETDGPVKPEPFPGPRPQPKGHGANGEGESGEGEH